MVRYPAVYQTCLRKTNKFLVTNCYNTEKIPKNRNGIFLSVLEFFPAGKTILDRVTRRS